MQEQTETNTAPRLRTGLEKRNGQLNRNRLSRCEAVHILFISCSFPVFLERDPIEWTVYGKFFYAYCISA